MRHLENDGHWKREVSGRGGGKADLPVSTWKKVSDKHSRVESREGGKKEERCSMFVPPCSNHCSVTE